MCGTPHMSRYTTVLPASAPTPGKSAAAAIETYTHTTVQIDKAPHRGTIALPSLRYPSLFKRSSPLFTACTEAGTSHLTSSTVLLHSTRPMIPRYCIRLQWLWSSVLACSSAQDASFCHKTGHCDVSSAYRCHHNPNDPVGVPCVPGFPGKDFWFAQDASRCYHTKSRITTLWGDVV